VAKPSSSQGNDHCNGNNCTGEHYVASSSPYCFRVILSLSDSLLHVNEFYRHIGWKFYLCFIIPGYIFAVCCWIFFPDTRHLALEEIAAIFGDADEIYRAPLEPAKVSLEMAGNSEHSEEV